MTKIFIYNCIYIFLVINCSKPRKYNYQTNISKKHEIKDAGIKRKKLICAIKKLKAWNKKNKTKTCINQRNNKSLFRTKIILFFKNNFYKRFFKRNKSNNLNKNNTKTAKKKVDELSDKELLEEFKKHLLEYEESNLRSQKELKLFAKLNYLSTIGISIGIIGIILALATPVSVFVGAIISLVGFSSYLINNTVTNYVYYKKLQKINKNKVKENRFIFNLDGILFNRKK